MSCRISMSGMIVAEPEIYPSNGEMVIRFLISQRLLSVNNPRTHCFDVTAAGSVARKFIQDKIKIFEPLSITGEIELLASDGFEVVAKTIVREKNLSIAFEDDVPIVRVKQANI